MSLFRRLFACPVRRPDQTGPVRVVVNALHAKSGGGVTYLRNMLPLMAADERVEIHLFLHQSQVPLFEPLDRRIVVHPFGFAKGLARLMLWEQLVLPFKVRAAAAEVVFSPANFGALAIRRQVIVLRNALEVAKTETRWNKRAYWLFLGILTFLSLLRVRAAIAVSAYAARSLGLGRCFAGKVRVIHHGINPMFTVDPTVAREDFLLMVSDIYVQKNLHTLLRALPAVFARHPQLELRVAGQKLDGWYFDRIAALAEELGIAGRIRFLGRVDAPALLELYRRCRVFVFPSTAETFGNPLVEAMACGAPIACSNATAMPEIVGADALLFDPLDPQAMGQALLDLLGDDALAGNLSDRAVERAGAFSWEKTARATLDTLIAVARPSR